MLLAMNLQEVAFYYLDISLDDLTTVVNGSLLPEQKRQEIAKITADFSRMVKMIEAEEMTPLIRQNKAALIELIKAL